MPAATMVSNTPKTTLNVRDRRFGAGDVRERLLVRQPETNIPDHILIRERAFRRLEWVFILSTQETDTFFNVKS